IEERRPAQPPRQKSEGQESGEDEKHPQAAPALAAAHLDEPLTEAGVDEGLLLRGTRRSAGRRTHRDLPSNPTRRSSGSSRTPIRSCTSRCTSSIKATTSSAEPPSSA